MKNEEPQDLVTPLMALAILAVIIAVTSLVIHFCR